MDASASNPTNDEPNVDGENVETETEVEESHVHPNKKKKVNRVTKAACWKFFTRDGVDSEGIEIARCNGCNQPFRCGGKRYGTNSLNRHMEKCTKIKYEDIGQTIVDMQGKLKPSKVDQLISREMCAAAIIAHDLPFKFVEFKKIRSWIKYLNPDVDFITRNTAKADVISIYKREKDKLKEELSSIPCRISLTSDLWTSCTTEGYICLTAHYIDYSWNLKSKILNFCHMPPPHTGFELSTKILELLTEWGIEKKIFSLTLDNASANGVMQQHLKQQLVMQDWLLCDGQFFHVRCSAHILNLIVQEGLKVGSDALTKIRDSVKYVRGSESRMKKFKECIEAIGGVETSAGLCLDVPTRWNSTYLMLQSALKYQRVFVQLHFKDENYKSCPSLEEWKRGEKICAFLLPFYETTKLMSGRSYSTSNLYFLQVWKIQCVLLASLKDDDEVIKEMSQRMYVKFQHYWDEYSVVLALGAVLDPRIKLSSLDYCYSIVDPSTSESKTNEVKRKLYMLFDKYSSKKTSSMEQSSTPSTSSSVFKEPKPFPAGLIQDLNKHNQKLANQAGKNQLDIYLDEHNLSFEGETEHLDVVKWWKDNRSRFTDLSLMARDLLSIPITTVASESAFSIGSIVLNKYRSRLLSKNVEALICTRNWKHGFVSNDEDDEDKDDAKVEKQPSRSNANVENQASNVVNLEEDDED